MKDKKYICCCSGGKDSTAMFLKILETKRPLDLVVICDIKEEYDWLKFNQHKIKELCETITEVYIDTFIFRYR